MAGALTAAQRAQLAQSIDEALSAAENTLKQLARAAAPVDLAQPIGRLSRMDALQQQAMSQSSLAQLKIRLGQLRQRSFD